MTLYPPIEPYRRGWLPVSPRHRLYFEECGNPEGKPALLLHGGPGAGIHPAMRRLHDPDHYRIVLFDQRGCGRSTPTGCLTENTTWDLVSDILALKAHLGITRCQIVGGSWGATLALAYAQTHPDRVSELILRGVFTLRQAELRWFYQEGCHWLFPDAFARFQAPIPPEERHDMIGAYYRRLTGPDMSLRQTAAQAWCRWEYATLSFGDGKDWDRMASDPQCLTVARIECHYFYHKGFFAEDGQLLANVARIRHIPGVIVQGRYDVITPLKTAWELAELWPKAQLRIVPDAGHALTEPGIARELVRATRQFIKRPH